MTRFVLHHYGTEVKLHPDQPVTIGRDPECELRIDDPAASRRHARILVRGDEVFVRDLDSANGVLVNGQRIVGETQLHPGDRIRIGQNKFELRESSAHAADTRTMNLSKFVPKG